MSLTIASLACSFLTICALAHPAPDELLFADGKREPVENVRKDSKGQWMGTREGRRVELHGGEIVAIVDAQGKETVILQQLADGPETAETKALVASLQDPKNETWRESLRTLGRHPARSTHDALLALAASKKKELRVRAIHALCGLYTKESVLAATNALLADKDVTSRRSSASALASVSEIFGRCDATALLERGIADSDGDVRFIFACLAPADHAAALAVLKNDGLKNKDHHFREDAAAELAERGDAAGEPILIALLTRTKIPGFDGGDELMTKVLVREQTHICALLGKLDTETGKAALKKALESSPHEAVRKAAEAALAPPKEKLASG